MKKPSATGLTFLLVFGLLCAGTSVSGATPKFLLVGKGSVGLGRSLAFSADGKTAFVGGTSKFVTAWDLTGEAPTLKRRYIWEISRGSRGQVNALAVSTKDDLLAVAGDSARGNSGAVFVFDRSKGDLKDYLWQEDVHQSPIGDLAFSPDGKYLLSADFEGTICLWNLRTGTPAKTFRTAKVFRKRSLTFISDTSFCFSAYDGQTETGQRWAIYAGNDAGGLYKFPAACPGGVGAMAFDPDANLLAASDFVGQLHLFRLGPNPDPAKRDLPAAKWLWKQASKNTAAITSLAFGQSGKLFATSVNATTGKAFLEQWDLASEEVVDAKAYATAGEIDFPCAVDAKRETLLFCRPDTRGIEFVKLVDDVGRVLPQPLEKGTRVEIAASVQPCWGVWFSKDGYRLAISQTFDAAQDWQTPNKHFGGGFDLKTLRPLTTNDLRGKLLPVDAGGGGLKLSADKDGLKIAVQRGLAKLGDITLDPSFQGPITAYAWIPDATGRTRAVAIGTQLYGVFVYSLDSLKLIRYYRDHTARVTSLSCAADGKYLASSSVDGSVKIWSLRGLFDDAVAFKRSAAWGATFEVQRDSLLANDVDPAGLAHGRGIRKGTRITKISYGGRDYLGGPALKSLLETTPLWASLVVNSVDDKGVEDVRVVVPAWEPVASLAVIDAGEWAMWTPTGYYASSGMGDRSIGWVVNGDKGGDPTELHTGDKFFNGFYRPKAMQKLLTAGSISEALAERKPDDTRTLPVQPPSPPPVEMMEKLPKVVIVQPADDRFVASGESLKVIAKLDQTLRKDQLKLQIDGQLHAIEPVADKSDPQVWSWNVPLATGLQRVRIEAAATEKLVGFAEVLIEREASVEASLPPTVTIEQPTLERNEAGDEVWRVVAKAKSNSPHPIESLSLLIDDRIPDQHTKAIVRRSLEKTDEWLIKLPPGRHRLAALATTSVSRNVSETVEIEYAVQDARLPKLRVVAVGVSSYRDRSLRLEFADDDARKIENIFAKEHLNLADGVYSDVQVHTLTDADATKSKLEAELQWLADNVQEGDVGIFFYSGHGMRDGETFYLVTHDADVDKIAQTCVPESKLKDLVVDVTNRGDIVLMIDACHSGALGIEKLGKVIFERNRAVVYMSSHAEEKSHEGFSVESGFFTHGLESGLRGKARVGRNKFVEHLGLSAHLSAEVRQLVEDIELLPQTPVFFALRSTPLKLTMPPDPEKQD